MNQTIPIVALIALTAVLPLSVLAMHAALRKQLTLRCTNRTTASIVSGLDNDARAHAASILLSVTMAAVFAIDGACNAYTLTSSAFASVFSARTSMTASLAWACGTAWLLYHLTVAAAHESARNVRRVVDRGPTQSTAQADHERSETMTVHSGSVPATNLNKGATRVRARLMLALLVLLMLGLSVAAVQVGAAKPSKAVGLSGRWHGDVVQTGPGNHLSNYETRIDLNGTKGRIDYPTLNCGGSLEHVRDDRDTSIFVEHLTYGRDKCIDGGRVAVRSHTNFVTWSWTYEEGDITVVGDLTASR